MKQQSKIHTLSQLGATLCVGLVFALFSALPENARAGCGESTAPCARLEGGKVVKEGVCETFECGSAGSGSGFGARFPDEKTGEDVGWSRKAKGMYSWYNCSAEDSDEAECAGDGYFLDGQPATRQENPVKGKGWFCYEKTGSDEVMCVRDLMSPDASAMSDEAARAEAAPRGGQFTGMIESVDPSDGPWLTLTGPKGRRSFLCGGFSEDCGRWQCRDLGRRLTVHYVRERLTIEGGEEADVDALARVDGPTGPADVEMNRVRCAADMLRAGGDSSPKAAAAANSLGVWYEKGTHGLRKDFEEAKTWYGLAAEHGNALAMHNLGDLYRQGKGVKQDSREAFRWYRKAADAGLALGLEDMADCYLKGVGVPPNRDEALRLYREAARKGRKSAAQKLREMGADTEPGAAPKGQAATDPVSLAGAWSDEDSHGRCSMSITPGREGRLFFEVNWSDSAFANNRWFFSGLWDAESDALDYDDGRLVYRTSQDNWQTVREEVKYEGGTGSVFLKDGALRWNDHKENICKDCVFKKAR